MNRQIDNRLTNFQLEKKIEPPTSPTIGWMPETKGLPLLRNTSSGSPAVDPGRAANTAAFHTTNLGELGMRLVYVVCGVYIYMNIIICMR